jgi:hypothetical protein
LPAGEYTSAKILQSLIEKSWKMKETDKDDPENKQRGRETLAKLH